MRRAITLDEALTLVQEMNSADPTISALTVRLVDTLCGALIGTESLTVSAMTEAVVRAGAIVSAMSARQGNEGSVMRLGALLWLRFADESDARKGYDAALASMQATVQ